MQSMGKSSSIVELCAVSKPALFTEISSKCHKKNQINVLRILKLNQ